jgi:pimeloyl-ACP methyl ester carboxylesterase
MREMGVALLVLLALVAVPPSRADQQPGRGAPSPLQPCVVPGVQMVARCGRIEVLESPDNPKSRRIPLRVVVVPAAKEPLPDPVLFLSGGPGQGAADLAVPLVARMSFLRERRDLILIDQRGTGASNPLTCPPVRDTQDLMGAIFDVERLRACRQQLATRADLERYTTSAAAADYDTVLAALGYRQVNIWGVSYGTRLALEIARRSPERVRSLMLEGVVPPTFAWPTYGARDADAALDAVIDDCEADNECRAQYSTFRRDVDRAFRALHKQPAAVTVRDPWMGSQAQVSFGWSDLAYATRGLLYGGEALQLPGMFRSAASARYETLAQAYISRARALGQEIATGVHLGVYCAEDVPFVNQDEARRHAQGTPLGTYLLDQYVRACSVWPRGAIPPDFRTPVRSSVPTLIMAGRRDPVTPPWSAEEAARTLPRARVLVWHKGGHGYDGSPNPSCKRSLIETFINTAQTDRLPVGCMR